MAADDDVDTVYFPGQDFIFRFFFVFRQTAVGQAYDEIDALGFPQDLYHLLGGGNRITEGHRRGERGHLGGIFAHQTEYADPKASFFEHPKRLDNSLVKDRFQGIIFVALSAENYVGGNQGRNFARVPGPCQYSRQSLGFKIKLVIAEANRVIAHHT